MAFNKSSMKVESRRVIRSLTESSLKEINKTNEILSKESLKQNVSSKQKSDFQVKETKIVKGGNLNVETRSRGLSDAPSLQESKTSTHSLNHSSKASSSPPKPTLLQQSGISRASSAKSVISSHSSTMNNRPLTSIQKTNSQSKSVEAILVLPTKSFHKSSTNKLSPASKTVESEIPTRKRSNTTSALPIFESISMDSSMTSSMTSSVSSSVISSKTPSAASSVVSQSVKPSQTIQKQHSQSKLSVKSSIPSAVPMTRHRSLSHITSSSSSVSSSSTAASASVAAIVVVGDKNNKNSMPETTIEPISSKQVGKPMTKSAVETIKANIEISHTVSRGRSIAQNVKDTLKRHRSLSQGPKTSLDLAQSTPNTTATNSHNTTLTRGRSLSQAPKVDLITGIPIPRHRSLSSVSKGSHTSSITSTNLDSKVNSKIENKTENKAKGKNSSVKSKISSLISNTTSSITSSKPSLTTKEEKKSDTKAHTSSIISMISTTISQVRNTIGSKSKPTTTISETTSLLSSSSLVSSSSSKTKKKKTESSSDDKNMMNNQSSTHSSNSSVSNSTISSTGKGTKQAHIEHPNVYKEVAQPKLAIPTKEESQHISRSRSLSVPIPYSPRQEAENDKNSSNNNSSNNSNSYGTTAATAIAKTKSKNVVTVEKVSTPVENRSRTLSRASSISNISNANSSNTLKPSKIPSPPSSSISSTSTKSKLKSTSKKISLTKEESVGIAIDMLVNDIDIDITTSTDMINQRSLRANSISSMEGRAGNPIETTDNSEEMKDFNEDFRPADPFLHHTSLSDIDTFSIASNTQLDVRSEAMSEVGSVAISEIIDGLTGAIIDAGNIKEMITKEHKKEGKKEREVKSILKKSKSWGGEPQKIQTHTENSEVDGWLDEMKEVPYDNIDTPGSGYMETNQLLYHVRRKLEKLIIEQEQMASAKLERRAILSSVSKSTSVAVSVTIENGEILNDSNSHTQSNNSNSDNQSNSHSIATTVAQNSTGRAMSGIPMRSGSKVKFRVPTDTDIYNLITYASENKLKELKALIMDKDFDLNRDCINKGYNALITAASKGNFEIVKFLVEKGASASYAHEDGITAFYIAAQHGFLDCVKFLLDKGAGSYAEYMNQALMYSVKGTEISINKPQYCDKVVKLLISKGANPNYVDPMQENTTPLMEVVRWYYTDPKNPWPIVLIKTFLDSGADMNKVAMNGQSAYSMAISKRACFISTNTTKSKAQSQSSSVNNPLLDIFEAQNSKRKSMK